MAGDRKTRAALGSKIKTHRVTATSGRYISGSRVSSKTPTNAVTVVENAPSTVAGGARTFYFSAPVPD